MNPQAPQSDTVSHAAQAPDVSNSAERPLGSVPHDVARESLAQASMAEPAIAELKPNVSAPPGMFTAMEFRDFRYMWSGNFLSNIGTWMQNIALGWLVLQLTNSAFWLGMVSFASSVPLLIFTLVGGVIADHVNKRKLLIWSQAAMMMSAFLLALLTFRNQVTVTQIMVLAFATGLASALAAPSQQALLPQLVPRRILTNAVGLNSAQFNMSRILGPTVGGFAMAWMGASGNFFLNGLSFLAVIFALWQMHYPAQTAVPEGSWWKRLLDGFRYVFGDPRPKVLVLQVAVCGLLGIPYLSFIPFFARDILHRDARGLGLLMAFSGLGAFLGALTIAYFGKPQRRGKVIMVCGVIFYSSILAFTFSTSFFLSAFMQTLAGYFLIIMVAIINTRLQLLAPDELRGRAMSIYATAYLGLPPIGSFLAGSLSRWVSAPHAIAAMAAAGLIAFLLIFASHKDLWELD